jgi:speckle-type POZ protein
VASPNSNTHKKAGALNSPSNSNVVFGVTKSDAVKGSLSWRILRFKDLDKRTGEYVESPEFSVGDYKWSLFLYPNGSKEDAKNYISIFLSCLNIFHEVTINFTVAFVAQQKSCADKVLGPIKKTFGEDELDWGWSKALDHRSLDMWYLAGEDSALYIRCDVEVFSEWTTSLDNVNHEENIPKIIVPACTMLDDMERLLNDNSQSDVKFVVGDQQFYAHKGILSVRSAVFRGMFSNGMREGREGLVNVEDIEPTIFGAALKFIYTGKCDADLLEDKTLEMLMVADKYDLGTLKHMCEDVMLRKLEIQTAAASLSNADLYHALQLKKHVLEFITSNFFEVIGAEGFREWSTENAVLVAEIHEAMAIKKGTKTADTASSSNAKAKKNGTQKRRRTSG